MATAFRKAKITTRVVSALEPGECVADSVLPGYFARRQKSAIVYFVRKHAHGRRHYVSIGEHGREGWTEKRARDKALLIIAALKQGEDPSAQRLAARQMPTLAQFAEDFIQNRSASLKASTIGNYQSLLHKHIAPKDHAGRLKRVCLGRLKLDAVSHQQIAALQWLLT